MQMKVECKWASGVLVGCSVAMAAPAWAQEQPLAQPVQDEQAVQVGQAEAVSAEGGPVAAGRDWAVSSGDWGSVGLLQTPGARMNPAGTFGMHFHRAWPYRHANLLLQPFDDLEVVMRYTGTTNRSYGPVAPDRTLIDKSLELKYRVLEESGMVPEVSVGMRDPLGTGLFSGEYLVAGKRLGDVDVSLGLGWGYLGARGDLDNPLGVLGSRFKTRQRSDTGQGGMPRGKSWFTGPVAVFGGVQWKTPWDPMVVKLEYEGNDYRREPGGQSLAQSSPINVGVQWRFETFDVGLAWERGNRAALNVSWMLDGKRMQPIALFKPPQPIAPGRAPEGERLADPARVVDLWRQHTGWSALGLQQSGDRYVLDINNPTGTFAKERLEAGVKVLERHAPQDIKQFDFRFHAAQVPVSTVTVKRSDAAGLEPSVPEGGAGPGTVVAAVKEVKEVKDVAQDGAKASATVGATGTASATADAAPDTRTLYQPELARLTYKIDPDFDQQIGGPDGYLYALSARARGRLNLWEGGWVNGTVKYRLLDNYDNIFYSAPSGLPRVRTDMPEYLKASRLTVPNLQVNQLNRWGDNVYSLAYAGLLETMFAGAGLEMMYRPDKSNFGVGFDVNAVRQRDFEQGFKLRDYRVNTGHVNAYWDTKWKGVQVNVAAGRYLAGDKGVTLELVRMFENGVSMGAWATKTSASTAQFGEGSFDKGIYISIPLDALFKGASGVGALVWQPLVRDGGARLNRSNTLWGLTRMRDSRAMEYTALPGGR